MKNTNDIINETLEEIKELNKKIVESDVPYLRDNMELFLKKEEALITKLEQLMNFLSSDPTMNIESTKYYEHLNEIVMNIRQIHFTKLVFFKHYKK